MPVQAEASERHEWDVLIAFLRDDGTPPHYKPAKLVKELAALGLGGERWLAGWVSPDAAFNSSHSPRGFARKLARLKNWIEQEPGYDPANYAAFRTTRTAVQREDRAFTFVGRSRELQRINRYFATGGRAISLTGRGRHARSSAATLKGFGGQGKTAIAHEYAVRYADQYAGILWINANDLDFEAALAGFVAGPLKEGIVPPEAAGLKDRLSDYFRQFVAILHGKILIVLDNIPYGRTDGRENERTAKLVETFLDAVPETLVGYYDILITCRRELLRKKVFNMPVERLEFDDAIELFRTRSGLDALSADDADLVRLVDAVLGGHALSITLAASLARKEHLAPADLIARIERHIVDASALGGLNLGDEYPDSLQATFMTSYEALKPSERYLLLMFTLFRRDERKRRSNPTPTAALTFAG